ncbi:MAG: hypothetical protein RAP03_02770 [Candidatus Electryonea clarkiae]|nr:hypothetical protein [Candidatus Electryonea clarkiae]
MKPLRSLILFFLLAFAFTLTACGPESQPATPTLEPTITDTPQPSLTPTPTEIPLPPGSEDLISRLEERATVEMNESGTFDLVYDDMAVGEMDDEGQIGFQVEGEMVYILPENLEVKDGVLVAVNRERTEEMGVDWVEQVWIERERVAVPEPVVGLTETYEETLVVQEKSLDYFMSKLLVTEKKYAEENDWIKDRSNWGTAGFPTRELFCSLPYVDRFFDCYGGEGHEDVVFTSWTRVQMNSGKVLDLIGMPFMAVDSTFGSFRGENYVWHFVFDGNAAVNWVARVLSEYEKSILENETRPEDMFELFKGGRFSFRARMFIDAREVEGWEEEYGWTEDIVLSFIERDGFEDVDVLMKRISLNIPGYNEIMGRQMIYTRQEGGVQVPEGFLEKMEEQLIPALMIWGRDH